MSFVAYVHSQVPTPQQGTFEPRLTGGSMTSMRRFVIELQYSTPNRHRGVRHHVP
ncbi:MAG TPA: hypothetical protein VKZ55_02325 [Microthrixaceae bacterium]|jgi:hypothetical protein|nr:hypothetical protein [Microthrixaceae bacterium]